MYFIFVRNVFRCRWDMVCAFDYENDARYELLQLEEFSSDQEYKIVHIGGAEV